MSKTTLCPIIWNHMRIQQNGDLSQCCLMMHHPYGKLVDSDGNNLNFNNIENARNHLESKKIRKDMMNGKKPSACKFCWTEESLGITSKRLTMLKKYDI